MHRLNLLQSQICFTAGKSSLTVVDSRTNKTYEIPITNNYIKASDLEKIKNEQGSIIRSYDPGYMNTINCVSFPLMADIPNQLHRR